MKWTVADQKSRLIIILSDRGSTIKTGVLYEHEDGFHEIRRMFDLQSKFRYVNGYAWEWRGDEEYFDSLDIIWDHYKDNKRIPNRKADLACARKGY